ncbi:MAG: 50S ribosomal protein L11 methyltransferase, partial [Planctomycetota bacterium]
MTSDRLCLALSGVLASVLATGCWPKYRDDLEYDHQVEQVWELDELSFGNIVQFESVFWEPDDTVSLREKIVADQIASNRTVLEIGSGTGLLSILSAQQGATSVIATDINPAAVACGRYNAAMLEVDDKIEFRQVSKEDPAAFAVLKPDETFDLIISNPPWEDGGIKKDADHAYYDPGFALMDSLLDGLPDRLNQGGRCLLAYGHVPAI